MNSVSLIDAQGSDLYAKVREANPDADSVDDMYRGERPPSILVVTNKATIKVSPQQKSKRVF